MSWTAVIPLKGSGERKTRLAHRLSAPERGRLGERMFAHVSKVLNACPKISEVAVLTNVRPDGWGGRIFDDAGRGLNVEISAVAERFAYKSLLVIHADLPLVSGPDIAALLEEAEGGIAIAPDRHGAGTNALAFGLAGAPFSFAFGDDSFARHVKTAGSRARVVKRLGLAVDVDTPEDYDAALALGCSVL